MAIRKGDDIPRHAPAAVTFISNAEGGWRIREDASALLRRAAANRRKATALLMRERRDAPHGGVGPSAVETRPWAKGEHRMEPRRAYRRTPATAISPQKNHCRLLWRPGWPAVVPFPSPKAAKISFRYFVLFHGVAYERPRDDNWACHLT